MKEVAEFLKNLEPRQSVNACWAKLQKNGKLEKWFNRGCHAELRSLNRTICFGSGVIPRVEQLDKPNQFNLFWNWISDPVNSPWRLITRDIELIRNNEGHPRGWIIQQETIESVSFPFIKNFCIATRMFHEYPHVIDSFEKLIVDFSVEPIDAFYLCMLVQYYPDHDFFSYNKGCHIGIHDCFTDPIDKKYWNLNPGGKNNSQNVNYHFMGNTKGFVSSAKTEHIRIPGKFGLVTYGKINIRELLEDYYVWKKHILE